MPSFARFAFALVATVAFAACRPTPPGASDVSIVGGAPVAPASPAAVSLVGLMKNGEKAVSCSGVLVGPRLVATARHCVVDVKAADVRALFGRDPASGQDVAVAEVMPFPAEDKLFPNLDVAWLRLAADAPQPFAPVPIWGRADALAEGDDVLLAGFGRTSSDCTRSASGCADQAMEVPTAFGRYFDGARYMGVFTVGPKDGKGVCKGDSGGPSYVRRDGRWFVLGVTSGMDGILNAKGFSHPVGTCEAGESVHNALGDFAAWIAHSSGVTLPAPQDGAPSTQDFQARPWRRFADLAGWLRYASPLDPAWYTITGLVTDEAFAPDVDDEGRLAFVLDTDGLVRRFSAKEEVTLHADRFSDHDTAITSVAPLAAFPRLARVSLERQAVPDYAPLAKVDGLATLGISHNEAWGTGEAVPFSWAFLKRAAGLTSLTLSHVTLTGPSWRAAGGFPRLVSADFSGSRGRLPQGDAWSRFPALTKLSLADTGLASLDGLSALTRLTSLDLSGNRVTDITALASLPALTTVVLDGNPVADFSVLARLPRLKEVSATYAKGLTPPSCPAQVVCRFTESAAPALAGGR